MFIELWDATYCEIGIDNSCIPKEVSQCIKTIIKEGLPLLFRIDTESGPVIICDRESLEDAKSSIGRDESGLKLYVYKRRSHRSSKGKVSHGRSIRKQSIRGGADLRSGRVIHRNRGPETRHDDEDVALRLQKKFDMEERKQKEAQGRASIMTIQAILEKENRLDELHFPNI